MLTRKFAILSTTAAFGAAALGALAAQPAAAAWPEKPITMVVGFKAGGGADTLGRIVANAIEKKHGWKIIVKNRAGAGGGVMAKSLKTAPKDGYTIGMAVGDPFAFNPVLNPKIGYTHEDFVYLGSIASFQMAVLAMKDKGWNTLADAMKAAKKKGSITFGSMAPRLHAMAKMIGRHYCVDVKVVPARGGRGVMNQLLGGHVDLGWGAGIQGRYVDAGKMAILASAIDQPLQQDPSKKTLVALGMPLLDASGYFLLAAPKGVPDEMVRKMTAAIKEAVAEPKVADLVGKRMFLKVDYKTPAQLATQVASLTKASRAILAALKKPSPCK